MGKMDEHAVDGMQQFAHHRDEGDHLGFALGAEVLIESPQVRLMPNGHQGGHVESAPQVGVAGFADAGLLAQRGARGALARVEASIGDPLADVEVGREHGQLGQDLDGHWRRRCCRER